MMCDSHTEWAARPDFNSKNDGLFKLQTNSDLAAVTIILKIYYLLKVGIVSLKH